MHYRTYGRTGLNISEISHGLWGMGDWKDSDDEQSMTAMRLSLELGCNFYDVAWAYGDGHSERLLGRLIKENPDKEIIVATKIPPKNDQWPATSNYSLADCYPRDHMFEYTEKSLENLGMDSVHIQQLHTWDDSWAEDESWQKTVDELKSQGLIQHFGISLNRWEPENGLKAIKTGLIDSIQVIYNIFDQNPEDELLPLCREMNVGVIARVPLDEGGLTGKLAKDTVFAADDWRSTYFGPENLAPTVERADALKEIVPDGMNLPEMALRFILTNPDIHTLPVGMRQLEHVRKNCATSDGNLLSDELMTELRKYRWERRPSSWSD